MERIASPQTSDTAIEQQIQAKGLTAPRVTPSDLTANIKTVHFFTARDGVIGGAPADAMACAPSALSLLTFCVIQMQNGFTVTGESACASPENFDAEIGRNIAYENAKQKMWPLMGYALKQQLCMAAAVEGGKQAAIAAFGQ